MKELASDIVQLALSFLEQLTQILVAGQLAPQEVRFHRQLVQAFELLEVRWLWTYTAQICPL
jgi:hypothetical protein